MGTERRHGFAADRSHTLGSAARGLAVLRSVYRAGEAKQLAEVSAETGIDKAGVLRVLSTLTAEGIIRRDPVTGGYQPDMRSWIYLMPSVQPGVSFVAAVQAALSRLSETTGLTAGLMLPGGERTTTGAMWARPRTVVHYDPAQAPSAAPLHATASGKCLLAWMPEAKLEQYLAQPLERVTRRTITSPVRLQRELARARRTGYAMHVGELSPEVCGMALPIHTTDGTVVGALALAVPGDSVGSGADRALPTLREAQSEVSRLLGYAAWAEFLREADGAAPAMPSPWDTPDPGFGDGPVPVVRSVARAMRLMAAVLRQPRGASLRELARQRGLDKTTAWRLLNTLVAGDVLWQDGPDWQYRVSPRFWLRHGRILRTATSLTRLVEGVLGELASATGATTVLVLPDREMKHSVVCRFALPQTPICFHPEHAPPAALHTTSAGKAYLAWQSRLAVKQYVRASMAAPTDKTVTGEQLLAELEAVRGQGYAVAREELLLGVGGCAVPVTDASGKTVASLSVASLAAAITPSNIARWAPLLKDAARVLSPLLVGQWQQQLCNALGDEK
jgi:IclR family KDG regulon transcriptional repressor